MATSLNRAGTTALTIVIDPDSLNEIDQGDYVDAVENELVAAGYVNCAVTVEFRPTTSTRVERIRWFDGRDVDPETIEADVAHLTERAFWSCCHQL